ncbi:MAG: Na/Pi cotransporter family protein [Phycisphaeraceae bacterium]|nr:Na/Pi cotransporter family protein [Phycisphaeraceae bacterium]
MVEILHAAGGIALLLFAIRFLRKGLDRLVGQRLDLWVGRVTQSAPKAAAAGTLIGTVVPSSTSLSLLTVSLVRDGELALHRAMALLLGAFVGITLTVHLIAFNIFHQAPILALVGVVLFQGTSRDKLRAFGQIILAVAFLFFGVQVISDATTIIATAKEVPQLVEMAATSPLVLVLLGMALTVAAQSSTATIAVLVTLGLTSDRLMSDGVALPFVVGANMGLCVTLMIAGWKQIESRRLGIGVTICRGVLAAVIIYLLPIPVQWMEKLPFSLAARIAVVHTLFNAIAVIVSLPFLVWVAQLATFMTGSAGNAGKSAALRTSRWPNEPAVALSQSKREIGLVTREIVDMLEEAWEALKSGDEQVFKQIRVRDDQVDRLDRQIKKYLTTTMGDDLPGELDKARDRQLRFLTDLETIGDVIDRNLVTAAIKKSKKGVRFSEEGWDELKDYFRGTTATLELASAVFVSDSPDMARKLLEHKTRMRDHEISLREKHYDRLQKGSQQSLETTDLHLEILSQLKHINHVVCGVAYGVLQSASDASANAALLNGESQLAPGLIGSAFPREGSLHGAI